MSEFMYYIMLSDFNWVNNEEEVDAGIYDDNNIIDIFTKTYVDLKKGDILFYLDSYIRVGYVRDIKLSGLLS